MASLGGSTVSSSYNRLLILPSGGGDGANLVQLKDGDEGTSFALKISNDAISINTNQKFYFDDGGDTYITESSNGVMDFYTAGKLAFRLSPTGDAKSALYADQLYIGHGALGLSNDSRLNIMSQTSVNGTSAVHGILVTGDNWGDDVIVLGRTDDKDSSNVVLNAKVGVGTHADYPTGPVSDFQLTTSSLAKGGAYYGEVHIDANYVTQGGKISGVGITAIKGSGAWEKSFSFLALDTFDTRTNDDGNNDARLGGLHGVGTGDTLLRLSIGKDYNDDGMHWWLQNSAGTAVNKLGIGIVEPQYKVDILANEGASLSAYDYAMRIHHDGGTRYNAALKIQCGEDGEVNSTNGAVTWGNFTANHGGKIPDSDNSSGYAYGTLLDVKSIYYSKGKDNMDTERGIMYNMEKTSSAYSKAVLGAYSGKCEPDAEDLVDADGNILSRDAYNNHNVCVLGDGHILCNNEKGNISIGDGITSSSTAGIGMKADKTCMIVGIAQENVTFSGSETKLVAVQYGIRQFTPWAD